MTPTQQRTQARLSKNRKFLIVKVNDQSVILNANLVRYLFDLPYTRKDGTYVSSEQIFDMKERAQAAYDKKARSNAG